MKVLRTLAYAAIILAVMLLAREVLRGEGFALVFSYLGFASFVPFACSAAAAAQQQKSVLLVVVVVTLLAVVPSSMDRVARAMVPIGVGIALGVGLRHAMTEAAEVPGA